MDRLTRWNGKKYVLPQGHGVWRQIAERLAAYENSGVEPEKLGSTIYQELPHVKGKMMVILSEEERCAIINALSRAAWNVEDVNSRNNAISNGIEDENELMEADRFFQTCQLIAKLGKWDAK